MVQNSTEHSGSYCENEKKKKTWKTKFILIAVHHEVQELEENKY